MRKSILRFGALALMSLMSISSWAQTSTHRTDNGSYYQLDATGRTATLTFANDNDDWSKDWSIIRGKDGNNYRVTEVYEHAFSAVNSSKSVTIPTTLLKIGNYAFKDKKIIATGAAQPYFEFSNSVELGEGAFEGATFPANTTIDLSNRESLPARIFMAPAGGNKITTVLCSGLTAIPDDAFNGCVDLAYFGNQIYGINYLPTGLNSIGANAFKDCKNLVYFQFKNEDINTKERSKITIVGHHAFQNCPWLDNIKFSNVFENFEGLTYGEGSFYGCGLTSVDLSESEVRVTATGLTPKYTEESGVPAYAFYGNKIETLKLPKNCVVIEEGAFASNYNTTVSGKTTTHTSTLAIPTLPSALKFIEDKAFDNSLISGTGGTLSPKEQNNLYLPNDFVEIGKDAFKNRTIAIVYAYPTFNTNTKSVPTLDNSNTSSITATVVPVVAPWTLAGGSSTNVKAQYEAKNWSGVRYATLKTTDPVTATVTYNDVVYKIGDQTDGVYAVTPKTYNVSEITIPGMFDNSVATSIESEGGNGCQYAVVFKVNMPTKNVEVKSGISVTSLTFSPNAINGDVANTFSDASYTEIPAYAAANCKSTLEKVIFGNGVITVAKDAFNGFSELDDVDLGRVVTVGDNAFKDIKASAITLPVSLQTFGSSAFGGANLKTVKVQYIKTMFGTNIPKPESGVFGTNAKLLDIINNATATREDYMAMNDGSADTPTYYWSQFFEMTTKVSVQTTATGANLAPIASVDDEDDEGNVTRVFELSDKNDIAQIQITGAPATGAPAVRYTRNFNNAHYQAWFVPFNYTYKGTEGCKFYYIYDTTQSDDYTADATTSIELKEVKVGKTIKANTPYIVKANEEGLITFESDAIVNTASVNNVTFGNVQNQFTFTGIYTKKEKTSGEGKDWYALLDGALYNFNNTEYDLKAYRFFMTYKAQSKIPYQFIKFNVLDDEDVTAIEALKAGNANAPMFDLQGRQIAAPAKGQVYIQNGVKKLAK